MKEFICAALLAVFSFKVYAAQFYPSGKVSGILIHDQGSNAGGPLIKIQGFAAATACTKDGDGEVYLAIENNEFGKMQFSLAVAAYMAGTVVHTKLDDTKKSASGHCLLGRISVD